MPVAGKWAGTNDHTETPDPLSKACCTSGYHQKHWLPLSTMQTRLHYPACRVTPAIYRYLCTKPGHVAPPVKLNLDSQRGVMEFIDSTGGAGASRNGRAWRTAELRLKSYDDLHCLWFILVKERNILLTERDWCRTNSRHWVNGQSNLYKVKRSMARIKGVVGERIRALKAKMELDLQREQEQGVRSKSSPGLQNALSDKDPTEPGGVMTRNP